LSMEWKDAKLVKVVVRSTLGGNLRLRAPNTLKLNEGGVLKKATGRNTNPFYQVEETPTPIISDQARLTPLALKETWLYDLPTQKGKVYTLVAQLH
jgi:alpha-L-fucosidase 2